MLSQHYKHWLSTEDDRRCINCENMHGKIYAIDEIPNLEPPLHEQCRCSISPMQAVIAGTATRDKRNGLDWWIIQLGALPPYTISDDDAYDLGWRPKRGNLHEIAPGKMLTRGIYKNRDGHLPTADGRIWFEADINYVSGRRNTERILFSNDGLIFVTYDHYASFIEIVDNT